MQACNVYIKVKPLTHTVDDYLVHGLSFKRDLGLELYVKEGISDLGH